MFPGLKMPGQMGAKRTKIRKLEVRHRGAGGRLGAALGRGAGRSGRAAGGVLWATLGRGAGPRGLGAGRGGWAALVGMGPGGVGKASGWGRVAAGGSAGILRVPWSGRRPGS